LKLYVCYGTFRYPRRGGHPCRNAHGALVEAGHDPEVVRTYGCKLNRMFEGRREVHELTGSYLVPALVLDDGTVVQESEAIATWAKANAAPS
jgi:glutathione S-transferase